MATEHAANTRERTCQDSIVEYFSNERGHVLMLSDDQAIITQLRTTLSKELGISVQDNLTCISEPNKLLPVLQDMVVEHPAPVLFIERRMGGRELSFLVGEVRQNFSAVHIIVLTTDVQRERVMYLHEAGADNVITKPVAARTIIEKFAATLTPQSSLGKDVDQARRLCDSQQYAEALAACESILAVKPGHPRVSLIMGDAYRGLKDYDKARQAYETAYQSSELYLAPLQHLADMYGEMGETE
ncbi:MAG: tetratricopeptide repeat protein, partial [Desulfovibrionaceae bacterium]|nr:tetratricopeptide repeat protein [Desulfovibrionaceae bacterium]